jgi:hypothetical protein
MNHGDTVLARTGVGCGGRVIGRGLEGGAIPGRVAFDDAGRILGIVDRRIVLLVDELEDLERVQNVARLV